MKHLATRMAAALAAVISLVASPGARGADITVFAAASLADALKPIASAFEAKTGTSVALSFGASSALARQIDASAGADLFISADRDWMDWLDKRGLIDRRTRRDLLGNRLVLIAPAGSAVSLRIAPRCNLAGALGSGRLAVADPQSVPAGKYARSALVSLGLWDAVAGRLAQAENVRVALAYVARAEAPLGVVYATDARAEPRVRIVDVFPDSSHPPIVYPAALTRDAKAGAQAFLNFLSGARAAAIFSRAGFAVLHAPR